MESAPIESAFVIAVDGPAASGKGTLAKRLAAFYDFAHLDTGSLYRAVGLAWRRQGGDPAAIAANLNPNLLQDKEIRSESTGAAASEIAARPEVRQALLLWQRRFAEAPPGGKKGAVLDGRDIGSIVCPKAPVKIFLTASAETRAKRRLEELRAKGEAAIYARVLADLEARDRRDQTRDTAPLKPADDAVILDTSGLDIDQVFAAARAIVDRRRPLG